jgi:hypothetical protein
MVVVCVLLLAGGGWLASKAADAPSNAILELTAGVPDLKAVVCSPLMGSVRDYQKIGTSR